MEKQENIQSQKNNLIIDACGSDKIKIWLEQGKKTSVIFTGQDNHFKNEAILVEIIKALEKYETTLDQIQNLFVCAGPGSYMSLRIITVIANTIAQEKNIYLWQFTHGENILQAKKVQKITPIYQR